MNNVLWTVVADKVGRLAAIAHLGQFKQKLSRETNAEHVNMGGFTHVYMFSIGVCILNVIWWLCDRVILPRQHAKDCQSNEGAHCLR